MKSDHNGEGLAEVNKLKSPITTPVAILERSELKKITTEEECSNFTQSS